MLTPTTMLLRTLLQPSLALALLLAALPAAAQDDLPVSFGDIEVDPDAVDLDDVAATEALLELGLARELNSHHLDVILYRITYSRNPAYIPALKRQAELWGGGSSGQFARVAGILDALWRLGEPEDYFYDLLPRWREKPVLARAAAWIVNRDPKPERLPALEALAAEVAETEASDVSERILLGDLARDARRYRRYIERFAAYEATPIGDQLHFVLAWIGTTVNSASITDDGHYILHKGNLNETRAEQAWAARRLGELARAYPSAVAEALDRLGEYTRPSDAYTPAQQAEALAAWREFFTVDLAALDTLPPPPPVDLAADVAPEVVCVRPDSVAWSESTGRFVESQELVARFRYRSRAGRAVRIPPGPSNALSPSEYEGQQPEVFQMSGDTWVRFSPGTPVTWTLPGGSATASASSPRCRDVSKGLVD